MKKLIVILIAVAGVCFSADLLVNIAQPAVEQQFTNSTVDQIWYPKAFYGLSGFATNNTISLKKVIIVGGTTNDITVDSVAVTTGADSELAVPAQVRVGKGEILKITRSATNSTLKGFITISGE